jgi:hypothetical protein
MNVPRTFSAAKRQPLSLYIPPFRDQMEDRQDSILDAETVLWDEEKVADRPIGSAARRLISKRPFRSGARWLLEILRPAIFTRGGGGVRNHTRRTAYLDGLRGFAAFLVYWQHHQLWPRYGYKIMGADYILESGYGTWPRFFSVVICAFRDATTGLYPACHLPNVPSPCLETFCGSEC